MFGFWFAAIVFFGTYIVIASEKVNKTTAALVGSSLMLLFILQGPQHGGGGNAHKVVSAISAGQLNKVENVQTAHENLDSEFSTLIGEKSEAIIGVEAPEETEKLHAYNQLDVFSKYVNFDVIFTLAGMMLLVNILSGTGIFQYVAIMCAKTAKGSPIRTMILLVIATAILSAFLDNVTTILLIAPVTLLVAAELGVPALPFLMAETMASNIGGTATLIGDPPNLIIGSAANLDFAAFIINLTPFIIIIMTIYCLVLNGYYRKRMHVTVEKRAKIMELDERAAITDPDNMRRGGIVICLTILGFLIHGALGIQPCVIAMAGASLALAVCKINVDHSLEKIEWGTLFFFMGLFILVAGAESAGLMKEFGKLLSFTSNWPILVTVLVVMWVSAVSAAIMNNVSFTAAMVTIIGSFLKDTEAFATLEAQHLMWWGLALAVCLGGNGTLVGAAANLVTAGIAEKANVKIDFKCFLIYGAPVAFCSMVAASIYIIARYYLLCV